jgi:hypothetical protein
MPIVVLDKKLPKIDKSHVFSIEKPATEGISDLLKKIDEILA